MQIEIPFSHVNVHTQQNKYEPKIVYKSVHFILYTVYALIESSRVPVIIIHFTQLPRTN